MSAAILFAPPSFFLFLCSSFFNSGSHFSQTRPMAVCLECVLGGFLRAGTVRRKSEVEVEKEKRMERESRRGPTEFATDARARFASSTSLFGRTDARLLPAHHEIGLVHRHLARTKDEREAEFLENVIRSKDEIEE